MSCKLQAMTFTYVFVFGDFVMPTVGVICQAVIAFVRSRL
jgi:hypothetical protein